MVSGPSRHRRRGSSRPSSENKRARTSNPSASSPFLLEPLSVITQDMDIAVKDMTVWVNRPSEQRRLEASQKKGRVSRPMNSFMLYRSAYAERTKAWCAARNHQVVSSVSGASWSIESHSVRDFYHRLSQIEQIKHNEAFPGYHYKPTKHGQKRAQFMELDIYESTTVAADSKLAASHCVGQSSTDGKRSIQVQHDHRQHGLPEPHSVTSSVKLAPYISGPVQSLAMPFPGQHQMYDDIVSLWDECLNPAMSYPSQYHGYYQPLQYSHRCHLARLEDDDSDALSSCLSFHEPTQQSWEQLHVASYAAIDPRLTQTSFHSHSDSSSSADIKYEADVFSRQITPEMKQEYSENSLNNLKNIEYYHDNFWSVNADQGSFWDEQKAFKPRRRSSTLLSLHSN